jgi:hypothetical protein
MTFLKTKSHRLDFLTRVCSLKLREFTAKFGLDPLVFGGFGLIEVFRDRSSVEIEFERYGSD